MNVERVIVRVEETGFILFFPDEKANPGKIGYYAQGAHGECVLAYYYHTKPPRPCDEPAANRFLKDYEAMIRALPDCEDYRVKRAYRR